MKLREKLESGKNLFGTNVFMGCKEYLEILTGMDFDFVFICAEHTPFGIERISEMVKTLENSGVPALVRLPEYDVTFTKKVLDMGVSAVLFPMIHSAEEAKKAMDICLYPPHGVRGFGPMSAVRWGIDSEKEFVENNLNGTLRMIQIEHIDAVEDLENIVKNPYIDGYVLGPNDLAASMGHIGDMYHEDVKKQIERAVDIINKANKPIGVALVSTDEDAIKYWKNLGLRIFALGGDNKFLRESAQGMYDSLKDIVL